jgi:hypothetical protein
MVRLETRLVVDGVRFLAVGAAQARMVHAPGVYVLARREADGRRTLLYVDWAQEQGRAARRSPEWRDAERLGMNELLFTIGQRDPEALKALKARLIAIARPPLNGRGECGQRAA